MAKPPTYEWRCHRCEAINRAHTATCEQCDFPAIASAMEVASGCVDLGLDKATTLREKFVRGTSVVGFGAVLLGGAIFRVAIGTSWVGISIGAVLVVGGFCILGAISRLDS